MDSDQQESKIFGLVYNPALSQSGRAAIEQLIGYNVLKELNLVHFR
jgi:hypothetical protein